MIPRYNNHAVFVVEKLGIARKTQAESLSLLQHSILQIEILLEQIVEPQWL